MTKLFKLLVSMQEEMAVNPSSGLNRCIGIGLSMLSKKEQMMWAKRS